MNDLNLARTKSAIDAYDAALERFEADGSDANVEAIEVAERAVGEAFALDTADRNDPETARRALPSPWLRGLVAKYAKAGS